MGPQISDLCYYSSIIYVVIVTSQESNGHINHANLPKSDSLWKTKQSSELKTESCHDANAFVDGGTACYHNDKMLCSQRQV